MSIFHTPKIGKQFTPADAPLVFHMSGNQFFHYFNVVTSTLFEQLKIFPPSIEYNLTTLLITPTGPTVQ
jgi:hypothetical protein